jgi:hypothetical protein
MQGLENLPPQEEVVMPIYTVPMKAPTGEQLLRILFSILIVFVGLNVVIRGFTAKYLFNEAEWPTVVEDLPKYEARFWDRVVVVAVGLGVIIFGFWLFPRS